MEVTIESQQKAELDVMRDLGELASEFKSAGLPATEQSPNLTGVKTVGLAEFIQIGGLALTSISTLITILTYWSSKKPQYKVTLNANSTSVEVSNLDKKGTMQLIGQLNAAGLSTDINIQIKKGD
jgi:hypothetical protein